MKYYYCHQTHCVVDKIKASSTSYEATVNESWSLDPRWVWTFEEGQVRCEEEVALYQSQDTIHCYWRPATNIEIFNHKLST